MCIRDRYKTHHSDWVIHRFTVREHGIALFGPPPATLIDPVSPDDVRRATTEVLRSWWGTADAVATIRAAPPGGLSFIALTMCRALYALERGEVVSKRAAAEWALRTQDPVSYTHLDVYKRQPLASVAPMTARSRAVTLRHDWRV